MSEPPSAYMKVKISRPGLTNWLAAAPPRAQRWGDWRMIGGRWHTDGGTTLREMSAESLDRILEEASNTLARFATNAQALLVLIANAGVDEGLYIAAYDVSETHFLAGTLTWSENLADVISCLALMRGIADHLEPGEHGSAVVHNYIWGEGDPEATLGAIEVRSSGASQFVPREVWPAIVAAFQPTIDAMLDHRLPETYPARLDRALRRDSGSGSQSAADESSVSP